jgi:hypothetical protein
MTDAECWRYFAYDYGWRQFYLKTHNNFSPKDPRGKWYRAELADAAEQMVCDEHERRRSPYTDAEALARCSELYGECAERWRQLQRVCFKTCRQKLGLDNLPGLTHKERIAAAYRWKTSLGEPLRPGIPQDGPEIEALLAEYDAMLEEQYRPIAESRARIVADGKNPDGSNSKEAIEHVELAAQITRAFMAGFVERSRKAFGNPRIGRQRGEEDELERIRQELGVNAKPTP